MTGGIRVAGHHDLTTKDRWLASLILDIGQRALVTAIAASS
jgi:hypothetical protein